MPVTPSVERPVAADGRLRDLLVALQRGDERGVVMSSDSVAAALGWSAAETANVLSDAKADMLVWGLRSGGSPQPQFDEIELTVQGSRYLRQIPPAS